MYNKELLKQVADEFSMSPEDVKYLIELYKDYVRAHINEFDPEKPLIDQYTGFVVPGIGYSIINKGYLTLDAFKLGLLDDPKYDTLRNYYTPKRLKGIEDNFKKDIGYVTEIKENGWDAVLEKQREQAIEEFTNRRNSS